MGYLDPLDCIRLSYHMPQIYLNMSLSRAFGCASSVPEHAALAVSPRLRLPTTPMAGCAEELDDEGAAGLEWVPRGASSYGWYIPR